MTGTMSSKKMCMTAVSMALVCIATMFFKVPIPLGYAHLGNAFILLGCVLMGNPYAVVIGGVGSAMADLLGGYAEWVIPTLIIKGVMGYVIGFIAAPRDRSPKILSPRTAVASAAGILIMIAGYFLGGSILYGSFATGAAQIPGLAAEGAVGLVLFYILGGVFEKVRIPQLIRQ